MCVCVYAGVDNGVLFGALWTFGKHHHQASFINDVVLFFLMRFLTPSAYSDNLIDFACDRHSFTSRTLEGRGSISYHVLNNETKLRYRRLSITRDGGQSGILKQVQNIKKTVQINT